MKRNRLVALLCAICVFFSLPFNAYADTTAVKDEKVEGYSNYLLKNMVKAYAHNIADNFYYGVNDDELLFAVVCSTIDNGAFDINKAVEAMIDTLDDKHAEFYTPQEFNAMTEDLNGEFVGIGVTITKSEKGILVVSVIEDSPAFKAGILEGDLITGVAGKDIAGMDIASVRNLIVGVINTPVMVEVTRNGVKLQKECIRDKVHVSQIETRMLTDDIAYLRLIQFATSAVDEVREYVSYLQKNKISKLVFDLRNNPGGDLDAALGICNTFISAGKIAKLHYKDETKNKFLYSENYNAPRFKMVILVNENSASASEFTSIAMKTRKTGTIIGTKTYGKGSMQAVSRLATGAGMKYTIGEFTGYNGEKVNNVGVEPDIFVENEFVKVDEASFNKIDLDLCMKDTKNPEMVLALEERLHALGFFVPEPDKVFDKETEKSVKQLQAILGYEVTGTPTLYDYIYLNDVNYDFEQELDHQIDKAVEFLSK